MMSKKLLLINELRPGMIPSMDINIEGKVLLAKGVALTESIIDKLKESYIINKVEVYLKNDSDEPIMLKVKTINELEVTFNEFSSDLENIFKDISTINTPNMNEIRIFSKKIQQEFMATGTVIKNVVLYGSGKDAIYRHSVNVAAISFILGKWLGLNEKDLSLLNYSAIMHDIGKTQLDKELLEKNYNLSYDEYETFKTHPVIGYHYAQQIPYLNPLVPKAILLHHERLDGSGYPLQLKEDKIPQFSKIIAIADVFDEVSSNRYTKDIRGPLDALKVIQDESLTKLDCSYCNMFLSHVVNYYTGENIQLNDGRTCKIIQVQLNNLTKPLLLDDSGFLDLNAEKDLYVEKLII